MQEKIMNPHEPRTITACFPFGVANSDLGPIPEASYLGLSLLLAAPVGVDPGTGCTNTEWRQENLLQGLNRLRKNSRSGRRGTKTVPQRLKPRLSSGFSGTDKSVPFQISTSPEFFRSLKSPRFYWY